MRVKKIYLIFFLIISVEILNAQQANFWAFKDFNGINFKFEPPTNDPTNFTAKKYYYTGVIGQSNRTFSDASVCNSKGDLLFYTDGIGLWDKNNNLLDTSMTLNRDKSFYGNGDYNGIVGVNQRNKIQVCCLNDSMYYLFNLFRRNFAYGNGIIDFYADLKLCIIKIVNGIPLVTVHDSTVMNGNFINITHVKRSEGIYWIILRDSCKYKSVEITSNNIQVKNTIVFSEPNCYRYGSSTMLLSLNKEYLFVGYNVTLDSIPGSKYDSSEYVIYRYNFNIADGMIGNQFIIEHLISKNFVKNIYCLGLSPDNKKLFIGNITFTSNPCCKNYYYLITQKDLKDSNNIQSATIYESTSQREVYDFQLGYNGKLYFKFSQNSNSELGEITQPDSFPAGKYVKIIPGFLKYLVPSGGSSPSTRLSFPGLDFEYHKIGFKQN